MNDVTLNYSVPENIISKFECILLHKKTPVFADKFMWSEEKNDYIKTGTEIIHVCEKCSYGQK